MKILYLMTAPPPAVAGTDAVIQEAELLRSRFGGERVCLVPSSKPRAHFPRTFYGLHRFTAIRRLERETDLHHIYAAELHFFPLLRFLKKPIVYTVVSGLSGQKRLPGSNVLRRLGAIVVPSRSDLERLAEMGLANGHVIRPGIDLSRFHQAPPGPRSELVLMAGSAPWTRKQFRTKGIDTLLRVARKMPFLKLVLLWRGLWLEEIRGRVKALELADRVEIIDKWVDISRVLPRVHAAVVLADKQKLVKAYPHSLLEALAGGRPVLVSHCISMAEYVRETGCGEVVQGVEEVDLFRKIQNLRENYDDYQRQATRVGKRDFSQESLVATYRDLYESLRGSH